MRPPWTGKRPVSAPDTSTDQTTTPDAHGFDVVRWWTPAKDDDLSKILVSAKQRARRYDPDVRLSPGALPPEFDELAALALQRMRSLQADTQRTAASYVERVLNHRSSSVGTESDAESEGRAVAAEHKIATLTESLRIAIAAQHAYAAQALALLDETFRHHHRFARWLEYEVPEINLPPDIYEVGLERIDTNQAETQAAS